ncbi:homoserine dehydrogenase [Haloferula chungangensis]|uniref:Homoserine dehydrogenase n=1 Tax=Haloferula chungangensis TaxID=1048331 RepID=A0ABW2L5I8_9BACT
MNCSTLGIGLAGLGTVGSGVVLALLRNASLIADRTGGIVNLDIAKVLVRDLNKKRPVDIPADKLTTKWQEVIDDPAVDIVVELIGGTSDAFDIVAAALRAKKPVVTGNKALLAERGPELFALSKEFDTPIHFEAAVAGGIPIIKTVQESFVGNRIHSMVGIINGTSNYILERMTTGGLDFETALAEAQQLGYAEADPALDVNGWDAAHKAILLATLAYGFAIDPEKVYVAGIEQVRPIDIEFATQLGYVVKLLAVIREHENGVELRLQPSFIAKSNILANVNGVFNAVAVHGDAAGESLFYGRGAGQDPTASSVVGDLVEAARSLRQPTGHRGFLPYTEKGRLMPVEETETAYYVRFDVTDRPGVIAEIAQALADAGIGISGTHSPVDPETPDADFVDMVFLLHTCPFGLLQKTLEKIQQLDCINSEPVVFRIEKL